MPAPIRRVLALITALAVAILGSAMLPAATATASGSGQSAHDSASDKSQGKKKDGKQPTGPDRPARSEKSQTQRSQTQKSQADRQSTQVRSSTKSDSKAPASSGEAGSDKAGTASDKPRIPGNNGTVKIAGFTLGNGPGHSSGDGSTPRHPSNDPHVGCQFSVEWFGFDASDENGAPIVSQVSFAQHAPTSKGAVPSVTTGATSVELDGDPAAGGGSTAGFDGVMTYELDFVGEPHPKHGYHLKVTVNTPSSQGSDKKSKVIWVEECEDTDQEKPGDEDDVQKEIRGPGDTEVAGVQKQVAGAPPSAPSNVPTVVDAGLGENVAATTRSSLPLGLVLLGLVMFVAALHRRVRA